MRSLPDKKITCATKMVSMDYGFQDGRRVDLTNDQVVDILRGGQLIC